MKMKHTPGPWKITDKIDGQFAYTPRIHVGPAVVYYTAGYHTAEQDSEFKAIAEANARLIAAAPELLDALQEIVEAQKGGYLGWSHIDAASAAIAKATGQ